MVLLFIRLLDIYTPICNYSSSVCCNKYMITSGGNLVRREVAHNLMRLIAEGTDDETTDMELRQDAVSNYIELLDKPNLPDILIKIICWVRPACSRRLECVATPSGMCTHIRCQ